MNYQNDLYKIILTSLKSVLILFLVFSWITGCENIASDSPSGLKDIIGQKSNKTNSPFAKINSSGLELQITDNPANQTNPDVFGNKIIWTDLRDGNYDVYLYDLITKSEIPVIRSFDELSTPMISDDKIIYVKNNQLFLYDLETKTSRFITSGTQISPGNIDGNRFVYSKESGGNQNVYLYSLSSGSEQQITTDPNDQTEPTISGNKIVWGDNRNGSFDIYMYNLDTGEQRRITDVTTFQHTPIISGDNIAWIGRFNVTLYNLTSGKSVDITGNRRAYGVEDFSGDRITYYGTVSGSIGPHIFVYDLYSGTTLDVTKNTPVANRWGSRISGNNVVWVDFRNSSDESKGDIYLYTVPFSNAFITGGGWIDTPEGSYPDNTSLSGKAQFNFEARYKNGSTIPEGHLGFKFQSGNMQFQSKDFELLEINDSSAHLTGTGTINGAGYYHFILSLVDEKPNKGNSPAKLRIRIWGNHGLVYDNQIEDPSHNEATRNITRGNISIHN